MDTSPTNKLVVNLSKFKLTNDHLSFLSKDLNFCPTPDEPNPGQNMENLDNLHRRLRLNYHFKPDLEDSQSVSPTSSDSKLLTTIIAFSPRKFHCMPIHLQSSGSPQLGSHDTIQ